MASPDSPANQPPKTVSPWFVYIMFPLVWGVLPWALSLLGPRYGWREGRPGAWNLLALIPLAAGIAGSAWGLAMHFAQSKGRMDFELDKGYMLTSGAYAWSRNPMYLSEMTLMFGWVLFFGSFAVLIGFLAWWAFFEFYQIPTEERTIEARFGESYRAYKQRVPRWFGFRRIP